MKEYIKPELNYKSFSREVIFTASVKTAEDKLIEVMTGDDHQLNIKDIDVVVW